MSDEIDDDLNPADRELEAALLSLSPARAAAGRIDPVAAAYQAGRNSRGRELWQWRAAAAVMIVVASGSVFVSSRDRAIPNALPAGPTMVAQSPAMPVPQPPPPVQSVLMMQHAVSENGLQGLPPAPTPSSPILRPIEIF